MDDDVERAFRRAHGQAVAALARVFGDITLAEDAVQDAFLTAVRRWPDGGVPRGNPTGRTASDRSRTGPVPGREDTESVHEDQLRLIAGPTPAEVAAVSLVGEAIRPARVLVALVPDEPEVVGLPAPVLLKDQDRSRWAPDLITEGQELVLSPRPAGQGQAWPCSRTSRWNWTATTSCTPHTHRCWRGWDDRTRPRGPTTGSGPGPHETDISYPNRRRTQLPLDRPGAPTLDRTAPILPLRPAARGL